MYIILYYCNSATLYVVTVENLIRRVRYRYYYLLIRKTKFFVVSSPATSYRFVELQLSS
jgi:hypothetical protein